MRVTSPNLNEFANHEVLVRWYKHSTNGHSLISQLNQTLDKSLEQVFGYHMLIVGADIDLELARIGKTQRIIRLTGSLAAENIFHPVIGVSSELPFASDSIDALIVCHALDTTELPHNVLRECQRVLVPNGHLLVVCMNPYSMAGLWRIFRNIFARRQIPKVKPISSRKLRDWLSLLGFVYGEPRHHMVLTPLGNGMVRQKMKQLDAWFFRHNVPFGAAYVIHARKRISANIGSPAKVSTRPQLISIPIGKGQEGVPVPKQVHMAGDFVAKLNQ